MLYLVVFLGAGLGGAFRLALNEVAARLLGIEFPFGTLIVNVLGAFAMGLLTEYFACRAREKTFSCGPLIDNYSQ